MSNNKLNNPFAHLGKNKPEQEQPAEFTPRDKSELVKNADESIMVPVPQGSQVVIVKKFFPAELTKQVGEITESLSEIDKINSTADAESANTILKRAKKLITTFDSERKTMTAILDQKKDEIIAAQKDFIKGLETASKKVNDAIIAFQIEKDKRDKEETQRIEKEKQAKLKAEQDEINRVANIKSLIVKFRESVATAAVSATIHDIDSKIERLKASRVTPETYQEFYNDAAIMYEGCLKLMNERKASLQAIHELELKNKDAADKIKAETEAKLKAEQDSINQDKFDIDYTRQESEMNAVSNIQMHSELKKGMIEKSKGVRKNWTFEEESIDIEALPLEFHTFDSAKIKAAIASGVREIPGVKIFEKITNVSR